MLTPNYPAERRQHASAEFPRIRIFLSNHYLIPPIKFEKQFALQKGRHWRISATLGNIPCDLLCENERSWKFGRVVDLSLSIYLLSIAVMRQEQMANKAKRRGKAGKVQRASENSLWNEEKGQETWMIFSLRNSSINKLSFDKRPPRANRLCERGGKSMQNFILAEQPTKAPTNVLFNDDDLLSENFTSNLSRTSLFSQTIKFTQQHIDSFLSIRAWALFSSFIADRDLNFTTISASTYLSGFSFPFAYFSYQRLSSSSLNFPKETFSCSLLFLIFTHMWTLVSV